MVEEKRGSLKRDQEIINRLKRIEGQVRGLQRMVDEDQYCIKILNQIAAVRGALDKVTLKIFERHTQGCVKSALKNKEDEEEIIEELIQVIRQLL